MSLLLLLIGGRGAPAYIPPALKFEAAFGYSWRDEAPVFTDITPWVDRSATISIHTGRSDEISAFEAGTCSWRLDNSDRDFDPTNTTGPWYGELLVLTPVRVTATFQEVDYPLFYGYVEGWPQGYEGTGNQLAYADMAATDALGLFAEAELGVGLWTLDDPVLGRLDAGNIIGGTGTGIAELSGARVARILNLTDWPQALRLLDDGLTPLAAKDLTGTPRDELEAAATSEGGALYADPSGRVVFLDRHAVRREARMATAQATFTDADFSMPYTSVRFAYDRRHVYNDVRRQRDGGTPQSAIDTDSRRRYFRRRHELTGLGMTTDTAAKTLADLFLELHREPSLRAEPLSIDPGNSPTVLFPQILGRALLDQIALTRTPQAAGGSIDQAVRLEGIDHQIEQFAWQTTWSTSPVDQRTYWTLDDPVLGLLDAGNLVGA